MLTQRLALWTGGLALAGLLCSCSDGAGTSEVGQTQAGRSPRDSLSDGLFADFLDGKYDSAGHPFSATVFEAETACARDTGEAQAEGWAALADKHPPGVLCKATAKSVNKGVFTLSVRALKQQEQSTAVLTVTARDAQGQELGTKDFSSKDWPVLTWQSLALQLSIAEAGSVQFEVRWSGEGDVRIDYVELFRSERQLLVSPASGLLASDATMQFEFNDPPTGTKLQASCDGADQTAVLNDLLDQGKATLETTEFRLVLTAPAKELLAECKLPSRFKVKALAGGYARATSRVSYRGAPIECDFEPGKIPVVLTGFEPFPADSTSDNSAERAVKGWDSSALPNVSVLRLILPVEYDAAPAWLADVIDRCKPSIVVGFGQGRSAVDLETTAYNLKDTAEVSGGVPDNRGVIYGGDPILADGPAELSSGLPIEKILSRLQSAEIDSGLSDDPGRYVCNNLFYTIMTKAPSAKLIGGFVHLPRMHTVDEEAQAKLQKVVTAVVEESVAALGEP